MIFKVFGYSPQDQWIFFIMKMSYKVLLYRKCDANGIVILRISAGQLEQLKIQMLNELCHGKTKDLGSIGYISSKKKVWNLDKCDDATHHEL